MVKINNLTFSKSNYFGELVHNFHNYTFSDDAENPINLPDDLLKAGIASASMPRSNALEEQKNHIYKLMKMDSYPRYKKHIFYDEIQKFMIFLNSKILILNLVIKYDSSIFLLK